MSARTIVILRPKEDSEILIKAVEELGYDALVEPILSVEYLDTELPVLDDDTALIFTSAHGVQAFARLSGSRDNPVYTVGRSTAEVAKHLGFSEIRTVAGTVDDLVELVVQAGKTVLKSVFYARGEDISKDLKLILAQKDIQIDEMIVYRANFAQNLSIDLLKRLDNREIKAVMLFSSRGGQNFVELVQQYDRAVRLKTTKALCISEAVVQSVSVLPFQQALIAETPDRVGMLKLLQDLS